MTFKSQRPSHDAGSSASSSLQGTLTLTQQILNTRMQSLESSSSGRATIAPDTSRIAYTSDDEALPPPYPYPTITGSKVHSMTRQQRVVLSRGDSGATSTTSQSERDVPIIRQSAAELLSPSVDAASFNRKKKLLSNKAYCIAKELVTTERTYRRDLTIVCRNLMSLISNVKTVSHTLLDEFSALIEPIYEFEGNFLNELEERLSYWEAKLSSSFGFEVTESLKVGDILLRAVHNSLPLYQNYINNLAHFLGAFDELYSKNKQFEAIYKEFENQKLCYLPVNALILKPLNRLLLRQNILARYVSHYADEGGHNPDLSECKVALDKISGFIANSNKSIKSLENFVKLIELERDLMGVENLVQGNRTFLRQGSLQRYSKKGPVQRLFILFDDCLLYANRHVSATIPRMTFKLHGQIPLRGLMLEDGDPFNLAVGLAYCFTIYGANRSLVVSASDAEEKRSWVEDISRAVMCAKESTASFPKLPSLTLKSSSSTDDVDRQQPLEGAVSSGKGSFDDISSAHPTSSPNATLDRQWHHRANDTLHVCWHRCTTLSVEDCRKMIVAQLSGYLLRKFRTSSGWQKLWVVYSDFCLFFYKSHQEEVPLASLPLLGYSISFPNADDNIRKDFVFKLHYKSHFYFFRADCDFTFNRWLEVLRASCDFQQPASPKITTTVEES